MRKPSRTRASATAVLLLAVAMPTAAAPAAEPPTTGNLPIPRIFPLTPRSAPDPTPGICPAMRRSESDPVRTEARQPSEAPLLDWWREWWAAATSRRHVRQTGPERPARTPLYLRSPMLSGFFGWGEPRGCVEKHATQRKASEPPAPAERPESPDTDRTEIGPAPHHR